MKKKKCVVICLALMLGAVMICDSLLSASFTASATTMSSLTSDSIKEKENHQNARVMYSKFDNLDITVDSSVKNITRTACMYLSEAIEHGIMLSENPTANIVIYDDRIDFGMCMNPTMDMMNEAYFPNFYVENDSIVYRFAGNADCEVTDQTIDYVGAYAPMTSEDNHVFNMIYSKYA